MAAGRGGAAAPGGRHAAAVRGALRARRGWRCPGRPGIGSWPVERCPAPKAGGTDRRRDPSRLDAPVAQSPRGPRGASAAGAAEASLLPPARLRQGRAASVRWLPSPCRSLRARAPDNPAAAAARHRATRRPRADRPDPPAPARAECVGPPGLRPHGLGTLPPPVPRGRLADHRSAASGPVPRPRSPDGRHGDAKPSGRISRPPAHATPARRPRGRRSDPRVRGC